MIKNEKQKTKGKTVIMKGLGQRCLLVSHNNQICAHGMKWPRAEGKSRAQNKTVCISLAAQKVKIFTRDSTLTLRWRGGGVRESKVLFLFFKLYFFFSTHAALVSRRRSRYSLFLTQSFRVCHLVENFHCTDGNPVFGSPPLFPLTLSNSL